MTDYSNITPEMARQALMARGVLPIQQVNQSNQEENNHFYSNGLRTGLVKGVGQGLGDIGASAINWPISGIEKLSGKKLPHVPHPHLTEHPENMSESIGQILGEFGSGFALPGGAGIKAAQLANKGYQAIRAGKQLPMIGKVLAGGAGGALEGAAGNEENRGLGGVLGGLGGAAGYAIPATIKGIQSIQSKNLAKEIPKEMNRLKNYFSEVFTSHLHAGEEAGANKFLKQEEVRKHLFKKAGESKSLYALEEFNMNPTLSKAHSAQSDLNKLIAKYSHIKDPKQLDRDILNDAKKAKNKLLLQISNAFEKSGEKQQGLGYQNAREEYATHMSPYLNSQAISALLGKGNRGVPAIRPSKFADKLLEEENFLAQAGHKHPNLLMREKVKKIAKHPLSKIAAGSAAVGTAGILLPYEIRKILGLH